MKSDRFIGEIRRHSSDVAIAAALLVAVVALPWLGHETAEGETANFDTLALLALRNASDLAIPIGPHWLLNYFQNMTSLGSLTVLGTAVIFTVVFLLLAKRRAAAGFIATSAFGAWLISNLVKAAIDRPRPSIVPHLADVHDASFPSGHATVSAATYIALAMLATALGRNPTRAPFFYGSAVFLTLMVGASRIYLGVHYPSDVIAGWSIGSGWAVLCWRFFRKSI